MLLCLGFAAACSTFTDATEDAPDGGSNGPDSGTDAASSDGSYPEVVKSDAPVAYWRFDETTMPDVIDSSGHGASGMYELNVVLGAPGALVHDPDTAAQLSGGMIEFGSRFSFPGKVPFAIEVWVKPDLSAASALGIAGFFVANGKQGYVFALGAETPCNGRTCRPLNFVSLGGKNIGAMTGDVTSQSWNHLVASFDGDTMRLYVNGHAEVELPIDAFSVPAGGVFTAGEWANAQPFTGSIDEMAVYDHDLPVARVVAHYRAATE